MKTRNFKLSKKATKRLWFLASLLFLLALWWILAETVFKKNGVIPSPPTVFVNMWGSIVSGKLWLCVGNTLLKVITGFAISFAAAFVLAVAAARFDRVRYFIAPIISVLRALPTVAVTLLMYFIFRMPETVAVVIGLMMALPMFYEGFLTAYSEVDKGLVEMAKVYKVPFLKQLTGIYLPGMAPYIFSSCVAGFGMLLKVIIAAEILGIPSNNTLGTAISYARQIPDFDMMFMWVFVVVLLSFLCETVIKLTARACMPWRKESR